MNGCRNRRRWPSANLDPGSIAEQELDARKPLYRRCDRREDGGHEHERRLIVFREQTPENYYAVSFRQSKLILKKKSIGAYVVEVTPLA